MLNFAAIRFSEQFKALEMFVSSYIAHGIQTVACIPDGSHQNYKATMDLQQIQ